MKPIMILFIIVLFPILKQSVAQNWISEYSNGISADSLIAGIKNEMQNEIGNKRPDLIFKELDKDSSLTLDNFKGYTVLLNFWGTHCSACRAQIPLLSELQKEFQNKGLKVIYISNNNVNEQKDFFNFVSIEGVKAKMERKDVINLKSPYQFTAEPSAYIIDASGIVRDAWLGAKDYTSLKKSVMSYIGKTR